MELDSTSIPENKLVEIGEKNSNSRRGVFLENGTCLLVSPTSKFEKDLKDHNLNKKIEYFRFRAPRVGAKMVVEADGSLTETNGIIGWEKYDGDEYVVDGAGIDGDSVFIHQMVVPPLEKEIRRQFADKKILGIRGTAASVDFDGEVVVKGRKIKNVEQVVLDGSESGEVPLYTTFEPNGPGEYNKIHHRSVQWVIDHARTLREELNKSGYTVMAETIFPVLLVYDIEILKKMEDGLGGQSLADAVLKAYVLDYPVK